MKQQTLAAMNGWSHEYPGAAAARSILLSVLERDGPREFAVELWDGEQWPAQMPGPARFKLLVRAPSAVRALFSRPDSLSFGEAFIYNQVDIKGSLLDIFAPADRLLNIPWSLADKYQLLRHLWAIPAPNYARSGLFAGFGATGRQGSPSRTRSSSGVYGWTSRWPTAVLIFTQLMIRSLRRKPPSSITSAASCGCGRECACSTWVAAGAP